jgi:hypothetical protein
MATAFFQPLLLRQHLGSSADNAWYFGLSRVGGEAHADHVSAGVHIDAVGQVAVLEDGAVRENIAELRNWAQSFIITLIINFFPTAFFHSNAPRTPATSPSRCGSSSTACLLAQGCHPYSHEPHPGPHEFGDSSITEVMAEFQRRILDY